MIISRGGRIRTYDFLLPAQRSARSISTSLRHFRMATPCYRPRSHRSRLTARSHEVFGSNPAFSGPPNKSSRPASLWMSKGRWRGHEVRPAPRGGRRPSVSSRGGRIRTYDFLLPKQARYQTAPHPDSTAALILTGGKRQLGSYGVEVTTRNSCRCTPGFSPCVPTRRGCDTAARETPASPRRGLPEPP
jgi:hypothetical protein